jgi:hypothetical protein
VKPHWNEDEFAEHLIAPRTQSHADDCDECRDELQQLDRALAGFREAVHTSAERPQFFWSAQQTAIRARLESLRTPHRLRWAIASAVALAALAVAMLLPASKPQPAVNTASSNIHVDQDELLMRQIDDSLMSNVAEPLQPASLIATDLGKAMQQAQPIRNNSKGERK